MKTSWLYEKPKGMRFVDLCIFVDRNIYSDNPDYDTCFKYIWIIVVMLATKNKYFSDVRDYEDFAFEVAVEVYMHMTDKNKGPIRSVLNYIKSIISFRRMTFNDKKNQRIVDSRFDTYWDPVFYENDYISKLESSNKEKVLEYLCDVIKEVPKYVFDSIPKVYKSNKSLCRNIYISSMLTLLNKFTIDEQSKANLAEKINNPMFNEAKFYTNHIDNDIILWHLSRSMTSVIILVINKVSSELIKEIRYISGSMKISESDFANIMSSTLAEGGLHNDSDN